MPFIQWLAKHRFNHVDAAGFAVFWQYIATAFWFAFAMLLVFFIISATIETIAREYK